MLQSFEYRAHWFDLAPYSDSYGSIFYAITTLHAAHVVVGLVLLCYIACLPLPGINIRSPHKAYKAVPLYWHFVDTVWIFIVLLLYVIPTFRVCTMAIDPHGNESFPALTHERFVAPRRLWSGFVTSAAAWMGLGFFDILICWRACTRQQGYGIPDAHPWARALFFVLALLLLALTVAAGITSYRNWRRLSLERSLLDVQGDERREFMAIVGVIVSVTLGMGIVWLALPPLFLDLCWRAK